MLLQEGMKAADIRAIRCLVDPRQAQLICEPWAEKLEPPTGYAAKWSLPYCLAAHALRGKLTTELFEGPLEADLLAFARRVDWAPQESGFPDRYAGRIVVTLADGTQRESVIADVLGAPDRPFPEDALVEKFKECATTALAPEAVAGLLSEIQGVAQARSLAPLGGYLRSAAALAPQRARVLAAAP